MTTATEETTDTDAAGPTLEQVDQLEGVREDTRDRLAEIEDRLDAINSRLAELRVEGEGQGEEAADLREERGELKGEQEELEATLPLLDEKIEEATEEAAAGAAADEIESLRRKVGGISGQHEADLEEAREHLERGVELLWRCETNRRRQLHMKALAEALAERFELELGEFNVLSGRDQRSVRKMRENMASKLENAPDTPGREVAGVADLDTATKAAHAADALRRGWDEDPHAAELLELVGEDLIADPNEVRSALLKQEERDKREAVMEAATDFLEGRVSGPTAIPSLYNRFQRVDLPYTPDESRGNLLGRAARNLGMVRVVDSQGTHHFAPEGFQPDGDNWRRAS